MPFALSAGASERLTPAADRRTARSRSLLVLATLALLAASASLGAVSAPSTVEPDLARLLRFMALLKGVFALAALAGSYWRLARPAASWREAVYLFGPGFMAAGAVSLYLLQAAGLATIVLHAGMFALLAAALTDAEFIAARKR